MQTSTNILQTFLSYSRRTYLARGMLLPEFEQGVCLFADISGFTPLTEALQRSLGPQQGAEKLVVTLNTVFDRLVSHVQRRGGDVIGFAGDAFTCWFPASSAPPLQALACAQAMRAEMEHFAQIKIPGQPDQTLTLKIGMAHGLTRRLLVGDPKYGYFDLLFGPPLDRIGMAEHHVQKGLNEIVCAPEMAALVGAAARWGEAREGYLPLLEFTPPPMQVPPPPLPPDLKHSKSLQPYFPPAIFSWLGAAGESFLAEFRPVVSAFLHFDGLDYMNDLQAGQKLNQYVSTVQAVAARHGGNAMYMDYGDKGSLLQVLFGAPQSYADDAARAVAFALEVQNAVRALSFISAQSIGMSCGAAYVGALGASTRRGYTAMGDVINAASRLMQACQPWQVFVSQAVVNAASKRFAFQPLPGFQVKGKSGPIPVSIPVMEMPSMPQLIMVGSLFGRQKEINYLMQALDRANSGQGQVIAINGVEGMGKSRLTAEIIQRSLPRGVRSLISIAQGAGQYTPYHTWREILRSLFGLQSAWPPMQQMMQMQTMLGWIYPAWTALIPLLGDLLGMSIPDTDSTTDMEGEERQRALFTLMGDLLARFASQQPLIILIEDGQFLDQASLRLIHALAPRLQTERVLLLVTHRPFDGLAVLKTTNASPINEMILGELSNDEVRAMLLDRLGGELPPDLLHTIQDRAQGNPLFVEELAHSLRETASLQQKEGRWVLVGSERGMLKLPESIQGIVLARLDRLDDNSKLIIKVASVVGRRFETALVEHLHPSHPPTPELEEHLDTLQRHQLSELETTNPQRIYHFRHVVIQEVAYETLLFSQRRALHRALAEWIEEHYAYDLNSQDALLAYHYTQAGMVDKAFEYLIKTGDLARRLYIHQDAIQNYRKALDLLEENKRREGEEGDSALVAPADRPPEGRQADDRQARTWMKLGLIYHTIFDYTQARQAFDEGFRLWQQIRTPAQAERRMASRPLRVDWPFMPLTLDPALCEDVDSCGVVDQLFSGLVDLEPDLEIVPNLAKSWEMLDDGQRYVFHLQRDARWSDGVPVTAHDFEFAWKRVLAPETGSLTAHLLDDIRGAKDYRSGKTHNPAALGVYALDDYTLHVELDQPCGNFLYLLAYSVACPVPRHRVQALGAAWADPCQIVTNGPFRLESCEERSDQDGRIVLTRAAAGGPQRGNVQRLELISHPEKSERIRAYESRELDVLSFRDLWSERPRLRNRHASEYITAPMLGVTGVIFDIRQPPFNDIRLRRALSLSIDRGYFADVLSHGFIFPGIGGLLPPGMPGHSPANAHTYDPVQANVLLSEAGYPGGRGLPPQTLITGSDPDGQGLYIAAQWRDVLGIQVEVKSLDWEAFNEHRTDRGGTLVLDSLVGDYPDPDSFLRSNPMLDYSRWADIEYQQLLSAARRSANPTARLDLYRQAEARLMQQTVIIVFKYWRQHFLLQPWVKRYPTSAAEWWYWKDVILED